MLDFLKRLFPSRRVEERHHPLFGRMWFWPSDDGTSYWESEPMINGQVIAVMFNAGVEGPSPEHERFLRWAAAEPDALFDLARPVLVPEYEQWVRQPFPATWREAFVLAGMELPDGGDRENPWSVSYDCLTDPAGHQFTAYFQHGRAVQVGVDG